MEALFLTGSLLAVCAIAGVLIGYNLHGKESSVVSQELQSIKFRYRQMQGFHDWYGAYDLESFDCGRSWYAMVTQEDGRRLILGNVESLYPGLLSELGLLDFGEMDASQEQPLNSVNELNSPDGGSQSDVLRSSLDVECERIEMREKSRKQLHCRPMPALPSNSNETSAVEKR